MRFVPKAAATVRGTVLGAVLGLGIIAASAAPALAAASGVYADRIVVGQSAALNGSVAELGMAMREGLLAAFKEANDAGGVKGRKIELMTKDDEYRADRALANAEELILTEGVFAMIGSVGTAPSMSAMQLANDMGIPFIGAFTGAPALRQPELDYVINIRASYDQEAELWIERLTADLQAKRIAILYQDDAFGISGVRAVKKALEKHGLTLVAEGSYYRNTTAVKTALLTIRKANPEAVLIVGAYRPAAEFIKLSRSLGMDPRFVTTSFVGGEVFSQALAAQRTGVAVTQVMPLPQDESLPLVQQYQAAMMAVSDKARPDTVSLEGYVAGRLFLEVLRKIEGEPTQRAFIDTLYKVGSFDLGGFTLTFGKGDNQGSDTVTLTVIQDDGTVKKVESLAAAGG
ncbi:ABC transporter substrate-binding protein [Oceanibaculum sp.]|uniref:ABC transporter substrate-binding protein n=1 Tax=Oceanibaculum sp. TaxID=1903597 RepID=UPI002586FB73|nr:ABC transporter substrate-binding protein [Oceanibaculum sp.]MCH2393307.1 ABC transporter substrate-binding protein [Oceanibaculum sp.]